LRPGFVAYSLAPSHFLLMMEATPMDPLDPANARTAIENILFTYAERIDGGDFGNASSPAITKTPSNTVPCPMGKRDGISLNAG
jgi:hypothetical protein